MPRGRPRKLVPMEETKILEQDEVMNTMEIKHVLRPVEAGNVYAVEETLNNYFKDGWKLFATHYVGSSPEVMGAHLIFYILIRENG